MQAGKTRKATHLLAGLVLLTTTLMWSVGAVQAASFTSAPERLYMAPAGTTLPSTVAEFVGVKVGTLEFDGTTDPISQDVRTVDVAADAGPIGCDTLTDQPVGVKDYDVDDCPHVQMDVAHGRLFMGAATTLFRDHLTDPDGVGPLVAGDPDPLDPVYRLPSGVLMDQFTGPSPNEPNGHALIWFNGTQEQIDDAFADLVYTPNSGYYYTGTGTGETINILLTPGDNSALANRSIEIRVLKVNGFPVITAPVDKLAQAGVELKIPSATPSVDPPFTGTEFSLTDPDNDENVDGAQANPPVAEDPLPDGAGDKVLLIGYLNCGVPTIDNQNGFHLRGGTFLLNPNDVRSLVRDFFDFTNLPPLAQNGVTALLDAIDVIAPGLTTIPLATNDPTDYTHLFAGIGTMSDVQFALSQVTFLQPAPSDTCTLWTAVSDLGNNGLPLQYFGSPPAGVELPMIGLDIDSFDIMTGALDEITVNFDAGSLLIDEGAAPIEALAELHITPAIHPEFTIKWDAVRRTTDPGPIPVGVATPGDDFSGTFNNTLTIPENATVIPIPATPLSPSPVATNVFADVVNEGNETFQYVLDIVENGPPPGWFISSSVPTRTVVIVDDDDAPRTVTVSDPTVLEGDSGTTTATFVLSLDGPADGNESVQVATADGTATDGNNDYEPFGPFVVEFDPGQTSANVNVTVNGDVNPEADETFALNLSNPIMVALGEPSAIGTIDNDDFADVSIDDVVVTEGHDPTTVNASFTVQLSAPAVGGEQITLNTANATATTADNDYDAILDQTITFVVGQMFQTVTVIVNGDNTAELDQTFSVVLSNPTNLNVTDGTAVGTITNDDIDVSIAATASIAEGSSGPIAISVSPAVHPAFGVTATTADVSTEPGDYTALTAAVVSVVANAVSINIVLQTTADTDVEGDEDLTVTLSPPSSQPPGFTVRVVDASSTVTISDDDALGVSINNVPVTEGNAGTVTAAFTVQLSGPALGGEQITVNTSNGTATTADNDYVAVTNDVITFLVGETSKIVSVTVNGDTTVEPDQTFNVVLSSPNLLSVTDGTGIGTITNDDLAPPLSIADASVTEGTGAGTTTITFDLTTLAPQPIDCGFRAVLSHVSTVDADFTSTIFFDVTAVFDTNDGTLPRSFGITRDVTDESDETFTLTITGDGATPCVIADGTATGTITNDDDPPPPPTLSIADATVVEGTGAGTTNISLDLSTSALQPVDCGFRAVLSHVSTVDADFTSTIFFDVTAVFDTNDVTLPRTFGITRDATDESDETFTLTITGDGATPCAIADGTATGTITDDDDPLPTLSIADALVVEQTGVGSTLISLNVTTSALYPVNCGFRAVLTHVTTADADFDVTAFFDVTAVWDTDDQDVPRTYSIDQDAVDELNETFTVTITGDVNHAVPCAIADGTATGMIVDDDGALPDSTKPTVTINQGATQDDPTTVASIVFDVVFSESVTGFATGEVSLTSSSAPGALVGEVTGSGASYTVTVTGMTGSGTVIVSIDAGVAQDAAANTNDASTSTDNSVQYNVPDTTAPTVTINQAAGQADPTTFSPILFTVVFSEPVTGFTGSDIVLSGTANANAATVSGGPSTYSVEVAGMNQTGSVIADIAAGAANDLAPIPNASTVSTSTDKTVQFNVAPGPLTLNLPANIVTNNDPGLAGATVSYPTATASGGTPPTTVVCTPASATFYPLGVTTVTCTATDSAAASVTGTFTIRVNDAEPPVIADLPDLGRSTTNITPVAVTFPNPAATDNSGVAPTVVCTPGSGSLFQVGIATVTCTATDAAGNQASSSFTVTVNSTPSGGVIPVTGSAPFGLLLAALAMLAAGLFLLFGPSRRRAPHTAASRR